MTPFGSLQLDRDPRIFRLWARWVPALRAHRVHAAEISTLRDEHAQWCERLMRVGLSTAEIKRTRLDTPLLPVPEREEWLLAFLAKRAKRQVEAKKKPVPPAKSNGLKQEPLSLGAGFSLARHVRDASGSGPP
jgi:hypothetical protein